MRRPVIGVLALLALVGATLAFAVPAGGKKGPKSNARAAKTTVFAVLSGKQEVSPTTGRRGAGDPDGEGSFTGLSNGDQFCFGINVTEIATPVAAHIHQARKGRNGPIVITLVAPSSGDPGASSGCVSVDPALLDQIRKHPKRFYANVHTGDFPNGAVRGQLFHAKPGQAK